MIAPLKEADIDIFIQLDAKYFHHYNQGCQVFLDATKQLRNTFLQSFGNLLNIHERHVPDPAFNSAVVRPVQSASLGGLFLINSQLLAHAADRPAKTDADIGWHCADVRRIAADAYTADESHFY
jgi:hypothetical protein